MSQENEICCPKFNPEKWEQKNHHWENKSFIKESMPTFFHLPLPTLINKKITKLCDLAKSDTQNQNNPDEVLLLFRDPSAFRSEIYLSVNKEVSGAENVKISGDFVSKVFDGPYQAVPKFIKEMEAYLATLGKKAKDYYIHYAYCPKCAKKYGANYMILFARV